MKIATIDTYFSQYIRLLHSKDGYCICCTCGKRKHWQDIDAGHFIGRSFWKTRWNEYNVHPQCRGCNRDQSKYKASNLVEYAEYIITTYGMDKFKELQKVKKEFSRKPRENELLEIGKIIKTKLKEINELR